MLMTFCVFGCSNDNAAETKSTVKVAFIAPLSGANALEGQTALNCFSLAVDEANAADNLNVTIEVVAVDDAGNTETGLLAAQELVKKGEVMAVCGHWNSPVASATVPVFKKAGLPLLLWAASETTLTSAENYPYVTRIFPTNNQVNRSLVGYLVDKLALSKVYIVSDDTDYGQENTTALEGALAIKNLQAVGKTTISADATDFSEQLAAIAALDVQAIYFGGGAAQAGLFKKDAEAAGLDVYFCGIYYSVAHNFIENAGTKAAEGSLLMKPDVELIKKERGLEFLASYAEAGYAEPLGSFSVYAYDAGLVMVQAIKILTAEGKTIDPANMATAIANSTTQGVWGTTTFDQTGQVVSPAFSVYVVQDGAWMLLSDSEYADGTRTFVEKKTAP